jgi:exonuclease III
MIHLNVRGMREAAKREHIIQQMVRHKIDIACLQETNIPDSSIEVRK